MESSEPGPKLVIKAGREKSLARRHPWVFSGSVDRLQGSPVSGGTVEVVSSRGEFLGWGAFSPASQIRARIWSWKQEETIGAPFFRERLARAIARRVVWIDCEQTDSFRLVHAESDGLPGLIIDQYGDILIAQYLSSGAEFWRDLIAELALEITGAASIYERSDVDVRNLEGLSLRSGPQRGPAPDGPFIIRENGLRFWVDVAAGHKTGAYLDQRANRLKVRSLAANLEVLDCFSYTGGFSLNALAGGAKMVYSVDASADALETQARNLELNGLEQVGYRQQEGDVFQVLRAFRDQAKKFDLVILDPPKFAQTVSQAEKAARGYKDINLLAFKLLRPGGKLVTFSCSGGVSEDLFQKIVAGAAVDAGVEAQILERLHQGPDHPVALNFPEGAYLKGFICQV